MAEIDGRLLGGRYRIAALGGQGSRPAGAPAIARVLDLGDDSGRPHLVMELLEGESLAERTPPRTDPGRRAWGPFRAKLR